MKYPKFLQKMVIQSELLRRQMETTKKWIISGWILRSKRWRIWGMRSVRQKCRDKAMEEGEAAEKTERAEQLMTLSRIPGVSYIFSAKGGDFLMEILPLLDFQKIRKIRLGFRDFRTIQDLRIPLRHCVIQQVFTGIILTIFPCSHGTMR